MNVATYRLTSGDEKIAHQLFSLMAKIFEEPQQTLSENYIQRLLQSKNFWAIAAFKGDELLGGLTAHTLPMTRSESVEIFVYDIAVQPSHQRQGVGKALVLALLTSAKHDGVKVVFVSADNEDKHAIEFYKAVGGTPAPVTFFTFED